MAKVNLNLLNIFYLQTKKKSIEYDGKTVKEIISKFIKEHSHELDGQLLSKNKKKLDNQILILLNGRNIKYLKNYKTELKDGDQLHLSVPLAGG
ncbi:MAG: MoaD/ThiS family protein [Candidatus Hodarchaeota archaeon]